MKDALKGAISTLIASMLMAMLFVIVYRFPIPLGGYVHGIKCVYLVLIAWVFYGLFGGFIVLVGGGLAIGLIIGSKFKKDEKQKNRMIIIYSTVFATCCVAFLSVLDKIIGPW